jgi:ATP-binding cassette subfamily C (CFTR/MRP) protein 1
MDRCYERLNASQEPFYLLLMVQQWLAFVLDTLSAILAVLVVILAIKVKMSSGFTGVGLVNLISFNSTLRTIIFCWALSETSIRAVSRIRALEQTIAPEELPNEKELPPMDWPTQGEIEIKDMTASYE